MNMAVWTQYSPNSALTISHDLIRPSYPSREYAPSDTVAYMPGYTAEIRNIEHERTRRQLIDLVYQFSRHGFSQSSDYVTQVSSDTKLSSVAFLQVMPATKKLPQLSTDGEGGLMMIWREQDGITLITVDGRQLHAVSAATTPQAAYQNDLDFTSLTIPESLISIIPDR